MHDIHAVIEDLHIGLQDVKVEGGGQQAAVVAPLITSTQQKPISLVEAATGSKQLALALVPQGCPQPASPSVTHPARASESCRRPCPWGRWQLT